MLVSELQSLMGFVEGDDSDCQLQCFRSVKQQWLLLCQHLEMFDGAEKSFGGIVELNLSL